MVQANELRIGNYVDEYGDIVKILSVCSIEDTVSLDTPFEDYDYTVMSLENLEPITLTEEILLKCGFVRNNSWEKEGIRLNKIRDLYFRANFPIKADIKYLHQLQNLYFALAGTELQINLN